MTSEQASSGCLRGGGGVIPRLFPRQIVARALSREISAQREVVLKSGNNQTFESYWHIYRELCFSL